MRWSILALLLSFAFNQGARAQYVEISRGDLAVAPMPSPGFGTMPKPAFVDLYDPSAWLKATLLSYPWPKQTISALSFDSDGKLWLARVVADSSPFQWEIVPLVFERPDMRAITVPWRPRAMLFDRNGNLYIAAQSVPSAYVDFDLVRVTPSGEVAYFTLPNTDEVSDFDVAADLCTVVYTGSFPSPLLRYDICRKSELAPLAMSLSPLMSVRILPGDGYLVSGSGIVHQLDAAGNVVRASYPGTGWARLALTPNADGFWVAPAGWVLTRFDLDGDPVVSIDARGVAINSIAVQDEWRAARRKRARPLHGAFRHP